jgi:Cys-tRNA(Pro) deacylase
MNSFKQNFDQIEDFLNFFEEDLENIRRVKRFCEDRDLDVEFEVHPKAETCEESARYSDIDMSQIVKTLIFKTGKDFTAVLAPGDRRVDTDKLGNKTEEENIRMAKPEEVEEQTGYVIGGVSPFDLDIKIYIEESLLNHELVRPAAGSRILGVELSPRELKDAVDAEEAQIT